MAGLSWFNGLDDDAAREALGRCCGSAVWVDAMMAARPFGSVGEVHARARDLWERLTPETWLEAFSHHPRIGDRDAMRAKFAGSWSAGEQVAAASASEETLQALVDGNREYENRFGHIFIVCATGKSAEEMLSILRERLAHEPGDELRIAGAEHAKITALRLDKLLSEGRS